MVLGLDGLSPDILQRLAAQELMPNVARMLEEGIFCRLRSSLPPNSCPAWLCMATGRNPGKLGVFDLVYKDGYSVRPVSSKMVKAEPIWTSLSRAGLRVGVVNVPGTYPPGGVRGFMVSGMLTPSARECLYPRVLKRFLAHELKDYPVDLICWSYFDPVDLVRDAIFTARRRAELAIKLCRLVGPDFLFMVFTTPDRIMHPLWEEVSSLLDEHDGQPKGRKARLMAAIELFWRELDNLAASVIKAFKPDLTLLVSDHGFGPKEGTFFVNECLRREKLLNLARGLRTHVLTSMGRLLVSAYTFLGERGVMKLLYSAATSVMGFRGLWDYALRYLDLDRSLRHVDWERTYAFCCAHTPTFGHAYVNLAEREPRGIVARARYEEAREAVIGCLRDVSREVGLEMRVFKREEAYSGPYVHLAPDVVFEVEGWPYDVSPSVGHASILGTYWVDTRSSGTHKPYGVLVAHGPDLARSSGPDEVSIYDVVPTILAYYGLPVPEDVDGKPIKSILA